MRCEEFVNFYLPAIRALLARELVSKYRMTQSETARKMYLTQAAVAYYLNESRGKNIRAIERKKEIKGMISHLAKEIFSRNLRKIELEKKYCEICKVLFKNL
ncbi:MAG: hypothetical protein B6U88_01505 [Candidatus Aenigmarchaeota archaeon ex4484_56]|nr:MAG: hypothetical protein B6U88_01505 [Candidatus Aenigmarchaeota archaeon ex4484_56]